MSEPVTLEEMILSKLPPGVRLVKFTAREVPFKVSDAVTVVDSRKFFKSYLDDLEIRIRQPKTMAASSLETIVKILAAAGLEVAVEENGVLVQ